MYVLWLAIFIAGLCWTMVMPFTPIFLEQLGVSHGAEMWSGVIIAVSSLCAMVMAPIWGAIGDRYGRRMMMVRAGLSLMVGYVLMSVVRGPVGLLSVRVMIGLLTGFTPMAIALVGVSTPHPEVGRALGFVQTGYPTGAIIGPVVGGIVSDWVGIRGASIASAVMIALAVVLVVVTVKEEFVRPAPGKTNLLSDLQVATSHRLLMAVVLISAISQASSMALEPVLVPFVKQIAGANAPGWLAGLLFSIPGATFILLAPWWARRGERVGFEGTIAAGLLGSAALYLLQTFVRGPWQLGGLRLMSGAAGAAIDPGVAALLATVVPRGLRGRAFGLNQAAGSAGATIGPLLGGWIGSYIDPRGVFLMTGLFCVGGFIWIKRVVAPQVRAEAARLVGSESA